MEDVLKSIVLGIGILLGIIHPDEPVLSARVFRDERAIYLNLEVDRAFPTDAQRLLESGNELTLSFSVEAPGYGSFRFSHAIAYDPISREYTVRLEETRREHRTQNREAAIGIASRVYGFTLLEVSGFDDQRGLSVSALCGLAAPGMDASVIWNYRTPEVRLSFDLLSGIPR